MLSTAQTLVLPSLGRTYLLCGTATALQSAALMRRTAHSPCLIPSWSASHCQARALDTGCRSVLRINYVQTCTAFGPYTPLVRYAFPQLSILGQVSAASSAVLSYATPEVLSASPASMPKIGGVVAMTGWNFGNDPSAVVVIVNGVTYSNIVTMQVLCKRLVLQVACTRQFVV